MSRRRTHIHTCWCFFFLLLAVLHIKIAPDKSLTLKKMPFCKWRKGKNSSRGGNFGKLLGNFEAITRRLPRAAHSCSVRALVDVLLFLLSYVLQARLNRCLTCIDKLSEDFSVAPLVPSETIINLISPKRPCQCFGKKERQKAKKKAKRENAKRKKATEIP